MIALCDGLCVYAAQRRLCAVAILQCILFFQMVFTGVVASQRWLVCSFPGGAGFNYQPFLFLQNTSAANSAVSYQ